MFQQIKRSPVLVRVLPFLLFLLLTYCQGRWGEASRYWFYLAKTVVGAVLIWVFRREIAEARLNFSVPAIVAGVAVFALWVGLDGLYPSLGELTDRYLCPLLRRVGLEGWCGKNEIKPVWNPHAHFGANSGAAWFFATTRLAGATLVVPFLEEIFYRSFLYRYLRDPDFLAVPLNRFMPVPLVLVTLFFALTHEEWLAALCCGFIYHGLVLWKNRLGDAIVAHGITNLLLGLWVITKNAWHFW